VIVHSSNFHVEGTFTHLLGWTKAPSLPQHQRFSLDALPLLTF
jgi:hypothetical protein